MLKHLLSCLCQVILSFFGWKDIALEYQNVIKSTPKAVVIFPHSSYFDYVFFILYSFGYNLEDFYTIMTERFSFIRLSNIIYAPDVYIRLYMNQGYSFYKSFFLTWKDILFYGKYKNDSKQKQNFVQYVCKIFENKERYKILISPTGSTTKKSWRSGFFYIAKNLDVPIIVTGIDYKNKTVVVNGKLNNLNNYEICKNIAEPLVNNIPSFHTDSELSVINYTKTFVNCFKVFILYKLVSW